MSMFKEFFNNLTEDAKAVAKQTTFVTPIVAKNISDASIATNHAVTASTLVGIAYAAKGTVVGAQYVEKKAIGVCDMAIARVTKLNSWLAEQK